VFKELDPEDTLALRSRAGRSDAGRRAATAGGCEAIAPRDTQRFHRDRGAARAWTTAPTLSKPRRGRRTSDAYETLKPRCLAVLSFATTKCTVFAR
jgi:hypothetical protein